MRRVTHSKTRQISVIIVLMTALLFPSCKRGDTAVELTIASYNVRYYTEYDVRNGNGWERRLPILCNLIQYHDFDIFGAQEVIDNQLSDMLMHLYEYDYVGVGRDDGVKEGEASPIFYKREMFELLQTGNFWLSETPEVPSKAWDAALPRICSWAEFRLTENGDTFWFFNTHLDHIGVEARQKSAELIIAKIKALAGDQKVILTGDLNADQNSEPYKLILASGLFDDAYDSVDVKYMLNGTFNNFNIAKKTEERIDHIFLSKGVNVSRYGVLTDYYLAPPAAEADDTETYIPRLPSDHYPVVAKIRMVK
jgi:Metal-dependent hydrolase